jgi:hypothetical protein
MIYIMLSWYLKDRNFPYLTWPETVIPDPEQSFRISPRSGSTTAFYPTFFMAGDTFNSGNVVVFSRERTSGLSRRAGGAARGPGRQDDGGSEPAGPEPGAGGSPEDGGEAAAGAGGQPIQ